MLRRAALPLAVLTGLALFAPPADAATVQVSIQNFAFNPPTVTVAQGGSVTWTNNEPSDSGIDHTSTDLGFWDSGHLSPGGGTFTETKTFRNAGTYAYICTIHQMHGTVKVPLIASGSPAHGFTVRWSSAASAPVNRNFDVQVKRPGATKFAGFRSATKALKAFFNPARAGTYKFRARTRIVSTGQTSGWSPVRSLAIS
jgi:plastocyanin